MVRRESAWKLFFAKRAVQDAKKLRSSNLKHKAEELLNLLEQDPFSNPPPFEKLIGDFDGYYSRRINIQHRIVYSVDNKNHEIRVLSMWTHYHS
jgi:toxin YoeB